MLRKFKMGGVILGALLALVGCQSEKLVNDGGSQQGQQFTLTASKGMGGSRTAIINGQTVWSEGDKIYVSSKNGDVTGVLTLTSEPGEPTGTFSGFVFGNPDKLAYSVFPAPTDGTVIDLSTIVGGGEVDAPMIGAIIPDPVDGTDVQFENACGVVLVDLPKAAGLELEIYAKGYNDEELSISASTDVTKIGWDGNKPYLKFTPNTNKRITITNSNGGTMYVPYFVSGITEQNQSKLSAVTFWEDEYGLKVNSANLLKDGKPNIVGSYVRENVQVHTYNAKSKNFNTTAKAESTVTNKEVIDGITYGKVEATITETQINDATTNDDSGNNGEGSTVSNEVAYFNVSASATTTGENNQPIEVTEVKVTLPQVTNTTQKAEVSISHVAEDATITIVEKEEAGKNPIQALTVVLPSGTTEEEAKEQVVIEMPNTTVTVKSADGNVLLINEAVATTGENTFIISEDVVINGLWVRKGNVDVYGKVKNWIKRHTDNVEEKTTITLYGNATVGNLQQLEKDPEFIVRRGGAEEPEVPEGGDMELSDFVAALEDPDVIEVVLANDIELKGPVSIAEGERKIIDLNGYTISLSEDFEWGSSTAAITNNGCSWEIKNGKIEGTTTTTNKWLIKSSKRCDVVGITLNAMGVLNAIDVENSNITIDGSEITCNLAENCYALKLLSQDAYFIAQVGRKSDVDLTGHVGITQNCSSDEGMGHSILSIKYGSVKGNLYIDGTYAIPERLNPQVDGCTKIEGENWPVVTYMTVKTESELRAALADERISEIHLGKNLELTSPISFNARKDLFLSEYTLSISDNFNWGDSDAAIIINAPDDSRKVGTRIEGTHRKSTLNGPNIEYKGKYIIKCNGYFELYNFILNTNGVEHAIKVEDCKFDLTGDVYTYAPTINVTSKTGYALDVYANTKDALVTLNSNGTINGNIRYTKNCNITSTKSNIDVVKGNIIGDLILEGKYENLIKVNVGETEPNGKGWPKPGQGGGEVVENTITIENQGLGQALMTNYPGAANEGLIRIDKTTGNCIISEDFVINGIGVNLKLRDASSMKSLKDLEKFTGVKIVTLNNTNLTSADFSKCVNLEEIQVSGRSLTSININGLTKLHSLDCSNSAFTELTLRSNVLKTLRCRGNQLTALNVTGLPILKILDCGNNNIQSLTLNTATALTILDCRGNKLTSLNVSGLPLTDLYCLNNSLTNLDVSQNDKLKTLQCGNQDAGRTSLELNLGTNEALYNRWINTWYFYDGSVNKNVKAYYNNTLIEFNGGVQQGNGGTGAPNFGIEEI